MQTENTDHTSSVPSSRRDFLAHAPAVALAATSAAVALSAVAEAAPDRELAALWEQYLELGQRFDAIAPGAADEDAQVSRLVEEQLAIGAQIEAADPQDLADIAIQQKLLADRMISCFCPDDPPFAQAIAKRLARLAATA